MFACVQCGQVLQERYCRKVPFRELQRFYDVMVSYERDLRVRNWLQDQVPPSIVRSDHTINKMRYDRLRNDTSFLYKLVSCWVLLCLRCHRRRRFVCVE